MPVRVASAAVALVALGLLSQTGCGPAKLNETRTWELDGGDGNSILLPAVSKPQTVKVEFTSSEGEVSVLLVKEDDLPKGSAEDAILGVEASKALGKANGKSGNYSAEVP